jgi:hypothetical protein
LRRPGFTAVVDAGVQMSVDHSNRRNAAKASRDSGFVIVIADIKHPEWRFQTRDDKFCEKWNEILNQMNEGWLPRT